MHKQIPSPIALAIVILLTGSVLFFSFIKSDALREQTKHTLQTMANKIKGLVIQHPADSRYAVITNDYGSAEQVLIIEPEGNADTNGQSSEQKAEPITGIPTSTEILVPTELEGFKPSPESEWARAYLQRLETTMEKLGIDIAYAREWQQTGGLYRDLVSGSKGADVRLTQYLLFKLSPYFGIKFDQSSITGTYGPKTEAAIMSLQTKLNIQPDGKFNNETRFFFDALYFKDLCPDADVDQDKSYENVNRRISVPKNYIPSDLIRLPRTVRTVGVMCLSREPARRLEEMFDAAAREGHDLAVFSAYRSARTQELLTAFYLRTEGKAGLAGIAEAGHSEHQLGTTVDLSGKSIQYTGPSSQFGRSPEGLWLAENSYKFGFILSYPQGKNTGYIYEPWHFRYIGVDIAKDIFEEKMTIQEYLNLVNASDAL
jgi:D-alanyl-D-alanine carboxypeptidase